MAELVIQKSLNLKETDLRYEQYRYAPFLVYGNYEWKWSIESGYQVDKTESLSLIGDYRFERYKTVASISKSLITGTSLIFDVARTSQKRDGDSFAAVGSSPAATLSQLHLILGVLVWSNRYGVTHLVAPIVHVLEPPRVCISHKTYFAVMKFKTWFFKDFDYTGMFTCLKKTYNESMSARDRYQKLVGSIQRKSSLGYTLPGELNQVQAEFEARQLSTKTISRTYLKQMESLVTFLNLPASTEIQFDIPKTIPAIPKLTPKGAKDVRSIQSQDLKIASAEDDLKYVDSNNRPKLALIGKLSATGVDESSSESVSELTRGTHPNAYVGLRLSHTFGSDVRKEEILNKKATLELEKVKQQRSILRFLMTVKNKLNAMLKLLIKF